MLLHFLTFDTARCTNSDMAHAHHHHDHDHSHHHGPAITGDNERRTLWTTLLIASFMLVEIVGGILVGSLALMADGVHMATDASALALAWLAFRFSRRPRDHARPFGYHRMEVIAAFINGLALLPLTGWIIVEAVTRFFAPAPILAGPMLGIAIVGLLVNLIAFAILHRGDRDNLNIQGAMAHVIGDLLGSAAAIIAALIIMATGWWLADPILSLLVAGLVLRSAWFILRQSTHVLMEGSPTRIDIDEIADSVTTRLDNAIAVHDIHVWMLTPDHVLATMHIVVADMTEGQETLEQAQAILETQFQITHSTVQLEDNDCHHSEPRLRTA